MVRKGREAEVFGAPGGIGCLLLMKTAGNIIRDKELLWDLPVGFSVDPMGVRLPFAVELWWQMRACYP